ncbi:MAG: hypothetical protein WBK55_09390 [Alphaproteobacteria bacterium]
MSDHLDYIDDINDTSGLGKSEATMRNNITAWFQRRLNIVESKYKEREEQFWDWMLKNSIERYKFTFPEAEPVPA